MSNDIKDDLLVTNKFVSSSKREVDEESLRKFLAARNKYPSTYTDGEVQELTFDEATAIDDSVLIGAGGISRGGVSTSSAGFTGGSTTKKFKRTTEMEADISLNLLH